MRGGRRVVLDHCKQCNGVWIDRQELADVSADLSCVHDHVEWIRKHGHPGRGITRCPHCAAVPLELPFFEVHIDYCPACMGVWLDGDERIGLARALEGEEPELTTYRHAAAAVTERMARCQGCDKRVPLEETYMTADGVRCEPCFQPALTRAEMSLQELNAKLARIAAGTDCPTCGKRYCDHP
jgi:Zn-finger nucleic acid-binding protein